MALESSIIPQNVAVDGVTLLNSSGVLQIKDGGVDTTQLKDSAVTYAKEGADLFKLNLLETISAVADSTLTSGILDSYDYYIVEINLSFSASPVNLLLRANGLSTNEYFYRFIDTVTNTASSGASSILLCQGASDNTVKGSVFIGGLSQAVAGGKVPVKNIGIGGANDLDVLIDGRIQLGNAEQISSFTLLPASGTMTGTIKIYGGII